MSRTAGRGWDTQRLQEKVLWLKDGSIHSCLPASLTTLACLVSTVVVCSFSQVSSSRENLGPHLLLHWVFYPAREGSDVCLLFRKIAFIVPASVCNASLVYNYYAKFLNVTCAFYIPAVHKKMTYGKDFSCKSIFIF